MSKLIRSTGFLLFLSSFVYAGVGSCPDNTYAAIPITGITGGSATSCGNASVGVNSAFAATPGNGTVPVFSLADYLAASLSSSIPGYLWTEGSAVQFANFTAAPSSTLTFDWEGVFEEGGTGVLFCILNGSLTELDLILPGGQGLPGEVNTGTVTVDLLSGLNTFAFGAISIIAIPGDTGVQPSLADPQLTLTNLAATNGAVPEPATFALTGLALAGLAFLGRRR